MKKLIAFDFVETLTDKDALYRRIHKIANCKDQAIKNVEKYRNGEFDEKELIKRNAQFHIDAEITKEVMESESKKVELRENIEKIISLLKEKNYIIALITSDYNIGAQEIKNRLNLDYAFGCEEIFEDDKLKGCNSIIDGEEKVKKLKEVCKKENIDIKETIYVGNDINDILIFKEVKFPIVIYPSENMKELTKSIHNINFLNDINELINFLNQIQPKNNPNNKHQNY